MKSSWKRFGFQHVEDVKKKSSSPRGKLIHDMHTVLVVRFWQQRAKTQMRVLLKRPLQVGSRVAGSGVAAAAKPGAAPRLSAGKSSPAPKWMLVESQRGCDVRSREAGLHPASPGNRRREGRLFSRGAILKRTFYPSSHSDRS